MPNNTYNPSNYNQPKNLDILSYFNKQVINPPKSHDWMKNLGGISNLKPISMGKSTDSVLGGLKGNIGSFLGKAGQEANWFGQDLIGNIGEAAKASGMGVGAMIDMGKGVVQGVLGGLGAKQAEVQGVGDKLLSTVSSLPLELIPGVGTVLKGGLAALDVVNQNFGSSSWKHGTDSDMDVTGYSLDFNENAGKKYSLFNKSGRKRTNRFTDSYDRGNLNKYYASVLARDKKRGSENTTGVLQDKNYQQMMGGPGTNILAARLGTKVPPVNLRKIANKAQYNFEQKNKFKDPILGQKGSKILPPPSKRTSVRKNDDGTHSTHLYVSGESDGKFVVYPTIYQDDKGEYFEAKDAFREAIKRGELLEFDTDEEAKAYAEGAWKDHYNYDGTPKKYKDGGLLNETDKKEVIEEVTEEKTNVIPEGAFHSRKNNIHEDYAEHVTKKGIPVITKDEEGKITQHAEVERNEIIFHKEATDTIESLHEKYKKAETQKLKDEIMIECGKYVAEQILVNTDDRTGIIKTI